MAIDHILHWLATLLVVGYAWQLHGFIAALAVFLGMFALIAGTNMALLALTGSMVAVRINRWAGVAGALLVLAVPTVRIEQVVAEEIQGMW